MNIINIDGLSKEIKNKKVLEDINISIEEGKIYGFIGHNGSGKTMLFKTIIGLVKPTLGTINFIKKVEIGATIENPGFLLEYTGLQNLKLLASIRKKIKEEDIIEVINYVGLDPKNKKVVKEYSLGMKQKLAIAQAIMEHPNLLILDEPTNGLDSQSIENIRTIIKEENKKGTTVLLSSHNKEDIDILCEKVYEMENGKIVNYINKLEN